MVNGIHCVLKEIQDRCHRADIRAKYSRMGFKKLSEMRMPFCKYM